MTGASRGWETTCRRWAGCAAGAALLLLASRSALAEITVGPPVDVPWLADVGDFDEVSVAVLADGSFAIAAAEILETTPETDRFVMQFFSADGLPEGKPIIVLQGSFAIEGDVGSLGDRYFVSWSEYFQQRARAAFFSERGKLLGGFFPWPYSAIHRFQDYYRFGSAPRWRFLPITYHQTGLERNGEPVYLPTLQVAGAEAQPLGPPFQLAPERYVVIDDAAIDGDGTFVVLSEQCPQSFYSPQPCLRGLQIFDGPGIPRTSFLTKDVAQYAESDGAVDGRFSAGIGPGGTVLVSWVTSIFEPVSRLVARLYDRQGMALSAVLPVGEAAGGGPVPLPLSVQALHNGDFVLSWAVLSPTAGSSTVFLRELETEAQTLSEPVPVFVTKASLTGRRVALNSSGRGVAVWQTREQGPGGPELAGHLNLITVGKRPPENGRGDNALPPEPATRGEPLTTKHQSIARNDLAIFANVPPSGTVGLAIDVHGYFTN